MKSVQLERRYVHASRQLVKMTVATVLLFCLVTAYGHWQQPPTMTQRIEQLFARLDEITTNLVAQEVLHYDQYTAPLNQAISALSQNFGRQRSAYLSHEPAQQLVALLEEQQQLVTQVAQQVPETAAEAIGVLDDTEQEKAYYTYFATQQLPYQDVIPALPGMSGFVWWLAIGLPTMIYIFAAAQCALRYRQHQQLLSRFPVSRWRQLLDTLCYLSAYFYVLPMGTWFVCAFGYTLWRGVVVWQAPYLLVVSGQVMAVPYWQMAGVIVAYQVTTLPLLYLLLRQLVAVIEDAGLLGVIVCGLSFLPLQLVDAWWVNYLPTGSVLAFSRLTGVWSVPDALWSGLIQTSVWTALFILLFNRRLSHSRWKLERG